VCFPRVGYSKYHGQDSMHSALLLNMTPPDELAMLAIAGTVKEQFVIIAICKHGQTQETTVAFLVCVIVTNGNLIHLCTVALLVQSLGTHNDSYSRLDWTTSRFIAIVVLLQLSIQSRLVCPQQARYKEMGVLSSSAHTANRGTS